MVICYFGIYKSDHSRNKIYIPGLKSVGVKILECNDNSRGFLKYIRLFIKHWSIRKDYDFLIVGYPGHVVVWFAKLISKNPIIFDALCTMEEGVVTSRGQRGFGGIKSAYIRLVDWLAVRCADVVLVESHEQKKFFEKKFGLNSKYRVVYTGVDGSVFYMDPLVQKRSNFTAVFRGKFLPEAGVRHIIDAAKILEEKNIDFIIIGNGFLEAEIKYKIKYINSKNVTLISEHIPEREMREVMLSCSVSLGQFEDHERIMRTIPHKCFESLAMGLPYITARAKPITEILKDGESVLFVDPADPKDLAEKILFLRNNPDIVTKIGGKGYNVHQEMFTPTKLAENIIAILQKLNPQK